MNSRKKIDDYVTLLHEAGVEPNFFISVPYLSATSWKFTVSIPDRWGEVRDCGGFVFPPLRLGYCNHDPCLVDFPGFEPTRLTRKFFDYEFIYRAGDFLDLSGGERKTFRKNCARVDRLGAEYKPIDWWMAQNMLAAWLEDRVGDRESIEFDDFATVWRYIEDAEDNLMGAFVNGRLVGFNAWDNNWRFVNFRYSFALEPYISEWLRLQFYRALPPDTLVNDGGSLGRSGLERFKRKLLPVEVRERWSWEA